MQRNPAPGVAPVGRNVGPSSPARRGTDRAIALGFNGMWVVGLAAAIRLFEVGETALGALTAFGAVLVLAAAARMMVLLRRSWRRPGRADRARERFDDR